MSAGSPKIIERKLQVNNKINYDEKCDQYTFANCRYVQQKSIGILADITSSDWQVGFFDADGEVYFDKITIREHGKFSGIVRNYWWNRKEGNEKKEGYYSLIKSVKELKIDNEQTVNNLADYVEGKYEAGEHWKIYELDKNIKLRIENMYELSVVQQTTIERISKHFDNTWCNQIAADLKTVNNITYSCDWYQFRNCKGVVPQKLVINTDVKNIRFYDADNEVCIPEIVMEEKSDLKSIIQNYCGKYRHEKRYCILPFIQTLVIRNSPRVLCYLADYINGKYQIDNGWEFREINQNIKIVIEKPGIAFNVVKEITDYFVDVLVDINKPEEYLAKQQSYQKSFQEHFARHYLETDQIEDFIPASQELLLEGGKLNVGGSNTKINLLHVNQKIAPQQFICFHDAGKPVAVDKIVIEGSGDLRCVLQNAYYDGVAAGFFSLLHITKELEIHSDHTGYNQVLVDFAEYIEGKYVLNANWKQEELDKDMKITINSGRYTLSLNIARRLRKYFKNVSIDAIWILLEAKNVIDQDCENKCVFVDSREASPQKLVINAKLIGSGTLILFNDADGEVHIPEIIIDERGCFYAIVYNEWQNNKGNDEYRHGVYSLFQYVETLTIRNNPGALKDFADYVAWKHEVENDNQELQKLSKDIRVVVEGPGDAFLSVFVISKYFQSVTVDGKQVNDYIQIIDQEMLKTQDYKAINTCFGVHDLCVYPLQCSVEAQKKLELTGYVYNIRKSVDSIDLLTVRQKMNINQFVCFHDIDKAVTVNQIIIEQNGDLRNVIQNAYYSNSQGGFFSLLKTAKKLEIRYNEQAAEDLADYVDGKYALHPKWGIQALDKDMEIKINVMNSPDVARRLRNYFRNVSIRCIQTPLETENAIDQECEDKYIFTNSRDANPQKLVVNMKLTDSQNLITFNDADGEVYISEITIGEHGSFDAIVYNQWQNHSGFKYYYYSLVSRVKILTIQSNPGAVCDLDRYISGNYKIQQYYWMVQQINKNIIVRIIGVSDLDEQINRLKEYFGCIFVDHRKLLRNSRQQMLAHINSKNVDIRQIQTQNKQKQQNVDNSVASVQEMKLMIKRAKTRLGRRRARFQEYLTLAE